MDNSIQHTYSVLGRLETLEQPPSFLSNVVLSKTRGCTGPWGSGSGAGEKIAESRKYVTINDMSSKVHCLARRFQFSLSIL